MNTNTRKQMSVNEIFTLAGEHCAEKISKTMFTEHKDAVKATYPTTVVASTVDKNGKRVNTHEPYKCSVAEVQVIINEPEQPLVLNKDNYIAELEKQVSKTKREEIKASCMEPAKPATTTVKVKPTKEFEVDFNREYPPMLVKLIQKLAKKHGVELVIESELEQVKQQARQKARKMIKDKQAL